jgi:hypothetical protein
MHDHTFAAMQCDQNAPILAPLKSFSLDLPEKTVFQSSVLASGSVSSVRVSANRTSQYELTP